ncbi:glycosyltransferase family 2 protein [Luedemannella flava]|uniref:dolichyl-phosphate beta-glucosyltransferase n=1 Tax=Luedemannella flava TaxID=349316 RepID=A0ABN2LIZ6_9ACTN
MPATAWSGDRVDLSVVVPVFNEELRLGASLATMCDYLGQGSQTWELVLVDDGSADGSQAIMAMAASAHPEIRVVESAHRGKGNAVRLGVLASRGQQVLVCDADLATPIEDVELLAKALADGHLVAIGSRAAPRAVIEIHQSRLRKAAGRLGNRLIRVLAVPGIADTQCGFKLFEGAAARAVFAQSRLDGFGFDFEVLHLCLRWSWSVVEVPVRWSHRTGSKVRLLDYVRVLRELMFVRLAHRHADLPAVTGPDAGELVPRVRTGPGHPRGSGR